MLVPPIGHRGDPETLTRYSYRLAHDHQKRLLAAMDTTKFDQASNDQPTSSTRHGSPGAFASRRSQVTSGTSSRTASAT